MNRVYPNNKFHIETNVSPDQQKIGKYAIPRDEEQSLLARTLGVISNTAQAGVRTVRGAFTRKQLPPNIQKIMERRAAGMKQKQTIGGVHKTKKGKRSKQSKKSHTSQSIKRLHHRM